MKQSFGRILALLLCAGLICGAVSMPASAAEVDSRRPTKA
jgi:hypothetical protein